MEMTELTIEIPKSQIQERNNRFQLFLFWTFMQLGVQLYVSNLSLFRSRIGLLSFSNSQLIHEFQLFKCQLELQSRYHQLSATTTVRPSACPRITSFRPLRPCHYHQPIPVPFGMASYEIGHPIFLPHHHQRAYHPTSYRTDVSTRAPFFHSNVFLPVLNHLYWTSTSFSISVITVACLLPDLSST